MLLKYVEPGNKIEMQAVERGEDVFIPPLT